METKVNKYKSITNIVLTVFAIFCFLILLYTYIVIPPKSISIADDIQILDEGWIVTTDNNSEIASFPALINVKNKGEAIILSKTLDDVRLYDETPAIMLNNYYADVIVLLDNEEIFRLESDNDTITDTLGLCSFFVDLPDNYINKELTIKAIPHFSPRITFTFEAPILGSKIRITEYTAEKSRFNTLLNIFLFLMSISFITVYFSIKSKHYIQKNIFQLGIFIFIMASYLTVSSNEAQLNFNHIYFRYILEYILFMLAPIPILLMAHETYSFKKVDWLSFVIYVHILVMIVCFALHFLLRIDFRETLWLMHIMLIDELISIIYIAISSKNIANSFNRKLMHSIIPIALGTFIDLLKFNLTVGHFKMFSFFKLGLIIFIIIQCKTGIHQLFINLKAKYEKEVLMRLAYTDSLTNLPNRAKFIENIVDLEAKGTIENLWIFVIDINNLKEVNDNFGHDQGDLLIIRMADILVSNLDGMGTAFRIGGDEFEVIVIDKTEDQINEIMDNILETTERMNKNIAPALSFAIGYVKFDDCIDSSLEKCIARADVQMYKNKNRMKNSPIYKKNIKYSIK